MLNGFSLFGFLGLLEIRLDFPIPELRVSSLGSPDSENYGLSTILGRCITSTTEIQGDDKMFPGCNLGFGFRVYGFRAGFSLPGPKC